MNIDIKDLPAYAKSVETSVLRQQEYVNRLAAMFEAGSREIRLFDQVNDEWTYVPLQEYWQMQQNILLAQLTFHGQITAAHTAGQSAVNAALEGVEKPIGGMGELSGAVSPVNSLIVSGLYKAKII